jgi:hypothetical protein
MFEAVMVWKGKLESIETHDSLEELVKLMLEHWLEQDMRHSPILLQKEGIIWGTMIAHPSHPVICFVTYIEPTLEMERHEAYEVIYKTGEGGAFWTIAKRI